MAYLAPTSDFVTSSLSGGVTAAATDITIGTGLDLPATNGILQIDYDSALGVGVDNGPETVAFATYNSGTGALAGCTRGLNGTTGVAHANAAKVQCGPSASYWGSGSIVSADVGAVLLNANLATTAGEPGGAWKAWTPTWTNLTVGAGGVLNCKYTQIGKTVHFKIYWKFGTGSAVSPGSPYFTLPVTSVAMDVLETFGHGGAKDANVGAVSPFDVVWRTTTSASMHPYKTDAANGSLTDMSSTAPFTWATDDVITCVGTYEAA